VSPTPLRPPDEFETACAGGTIGSRGSSARFRSGAFHVTAQIRP
jgi:hypothetical protein